MKLEIEIPEGKKAEWVDGVFTLVDEQPPKFKFNVGDKVIYTVMKDEVFTINKREILDDKPHYFLVDTDGISFSVVSERFLEPYTEPKDITERIKTFEDACKWCTENGHHNIRREYDCIVTDTLILDEVSPDLIAYLKLRIITCALNEGWEIDIHQGDKIYSISCDQWDNELTVHENVRIMLIPKILIFKSKELALYAATQFKGIYLDFFHKGKE